MAIPTFSPSRNAELPYAEKSHFVTESLEFQKGYEEIRAHLLRPVRNPVVLRWSAADEDLKDYIASFFTQFNGQKGPFYWSPYDKVPSPTGIQPTLGQVAGGALASKTYYVVFTWYDSSYGETKESAQASFTVSANYYLTVTVPALPQGVDSWRIYAHETPGSECLQATITSFERTWTQSGAMSTGTADPPGTNTLLPLLKWNLVGDIEQTRTRPNRWDIQISFAETIV